jgi:hypothetical protein
MRYDVAISGIKTARNEVVHGRSIETIMALYFCADRY